MDFDFGAPLPRPVWLYVWKADGCYACEEAEPFLRALKVKYPLRVMVVERYINRSEQKVPGIDWLPSSTPAYALVDQNGAEKRLLRKRVGTMGLEELEKWIGPDFLPGKGNT